MKKKKAKVFLTRHSQMRFEERIDVSASELASKAAKAFDEGYEANEVKDPLSAFLKSVSFQSGRYVAKVYEDTVYIFENNHGHRVITVYKVPEEYTPVDKYIIPEEELGRCMIALTNKLDGKTFYWHEFGGLTDDICEALEFQNQIKATNYLSNNHELDKFKADYEIELF